MIPTAFRPLSIAAVYLRKRALDLGRKTRKTTVLNEIHELFILRAVRAGDSAIVTALEIPPLLGGPFGGLNAGSDYFLPSVDANYGPLLNAITKPTFKTVDGVPAPSLTDDPKFGTALGSGRVVIGTLPSWDTPRDALNATVGQYYVYPSAFLVPVCPTLDDGTTPHTRSLLVTRTNAYTKSTRLEDVDPGAGRPALNGDEPTGRPERIGAVEFSREALGGTTDDLLSRAAACLEWGPLRGIASAALDTQGEPRRRLALIGYNIADGGVDAVPRYVGSAAWQSDVSDDTVPAGDASQAITAESDVAPGYNFPAWANTNGDPHGRSASDGAFAIPEADLTRLWAVNAGYPAVEGAMLLVQVVAGKTAANFDAEAWTGDPTAPVYGTFSVPAVQANKYSTYVVVIDAIGGLTYTALNQFTHAIYDPAWFAELERINYRAYLGLNTFAGDPRLVCTKRTHNYEILDAEPDTPETPTTPRVQGELERKALTEFDAYTRLADLDYVLVSSTGAETTLAMGDYYPILFTYETGVVGMSPAPTDGRIGYATQTLKNAEPRYAIDLPAPFCQYAPGILAVLLSPKSDYTSSSHLLHIGLFDVATGALVQLSAVLLGYLTATRFTLTCFEQGTVDEDGELTAHGRLLITTSTLSAAPDRQDGVFAVSGLSEVTWVSREPSNTPLHYLGNPIVPSTIGVSTNLIGIKPSKIPE